MASNPETEQNKSDVVAFHETVERLAIGLEEAEHELKPVLKKREKEIGLVKCRDCPRVGEVVKRNSMGDGYCPTSDKVLTGFFNSKRALNVPRHCAFFNGEASTQEG